MIKLSVSSYSFHQYVKRGDLTLEGCIQKAAELGFSAVEIVDAAQEKNEETERYVRKLGGLAKEYGLAVSNFTCAANLACRDIDGEISRLKGLVDLAALAGAPSMRHDAAFDLGDFRSFAQALPQMAAACREVTAYAEQKGVKTMVENHGMVCQESRRVEALFDAVHHPNFGLLVDMGNFLCADENPADAVGRLAPYAFYAHGKDFIVKPSDGPDPGRGFFHSRSGNYLRGTIVGQGNVPVLHCLRALKGAGFDGYLAIEFEGMEDAIEAISIGKENLERYFCLL